MEDFGNAEDPRDDPLFDAGDPPIFRHPSEIGAMMAAANGVPTPPASNRHPVGLISLGASLALLAVIVVSLASPDPDADNFVLTRQASAISQVGLESTTVPPTTIGDPSTPTLVSDGVIRIERWGGGKAAKGNGVVIYEDGYIATSRSLVAGGTQLLVTAPDGDTYKAEIVGADFILDIAVIKIESSEMSVAPTATSEPSVGSTVSVIDTWSTQQSGTPVLDTDKVVADRTGFHRQELLEFDAPVGDQSAGAPIVNDDGEVVAMLLPVDQTGPMNYALDISAVRKASYELIESGFVNHVAWIGIKGTSADRSNGVIVNDVVDGSPADDAGIEAGDQIITVARRNVSSMASLLRTLDDLTSRQITQITLLRDGEMIELDITLGIRADI